MAPAGLKEWVEVLGPARGQGEKGFECELQPPRFPTVARGNAGKPVGTAGEGEGRGDPALP